MGPGKEAPKGKISSVHEKNLRSCEKPLQWSLELFRLEMSFGLMDQEHWRGKSCRRDQSEAWCGLKGPLSMSLASREPEFLSTSCFNQGHSAFLRKDEMILLHWTW